MRAAFERVDFRIAQLTAAPQLIAHQGPYVTDSNEAGDIDLVNMDGDIKINLILTIFTRSRLCIA